MATFGHPPFSVVYGVTAPPPLWSLAPGIPAETAWLGRTRVSQGFSLLFHSALSGTVSGPRPASHSLQMSLFIMRSCLPWFVGIMDAFPVLFT